MIRLSWLISIAISFFGFMMTGELFGVQPKNSNGNLGFVGLIFLFPFILLSLFTTFRYFYTVSQTSNRLTKGLGIIAGLFFLWFFTFLTMNNKDELSQNMVNSSSFFDEKTSQIYLNFYVFGLIHTLSAFIGWIIGMFFTLKHPE